MNIAVISDTHGLIPDSLKETLERSDYVIHAGDIGSFAVYQELKRLNPNTCFVKGNCDRAVWAAELPETLLFHLDGILFYVIHNQADIAFRPENAQLIICGHTHRYAATTWRHAVLLNPGSCSQPRDGAASCAILTTGNGTWNIQRMLL